MAIKVTKRGSDPKHRQMIGTCRNCKTEIECLASDTTSYYGSQMDPESYMYVKCPTCNQKIVVNDKPIVDSRFIGFDYSGER